MVGAPSRFVSVQHHARECGHLFSFEIEEERCRPMATKKTTTRKEVPLNEVPGYELLTPIEELPILTQIDVLALSEQLFVSEDTRPTGERFKELYEFMREHLAVDAGKLDDWAKGRGGVNRAVDLGVAYIMEVGKDAD